jgi:hypothetical protein
VVTWKRSLFALGLLFTSTGDVWAECSGSDSVGACNDGNIYVGLSDSSTPGGLRWNRQTTNVGDTSYADDMSSGMSPAQPPSYHETRLRPIYGTDSEGRPQMYACDPYSGCR